MNILSKDIIYQINLMSTEREFDIYEACGYLAGILFTVGLIPQVYKSYKTKNLRDISYAWQFIYLSATIVMVIYGTHKELPPIYIPTLFEIVLILSLIIMKIIYKEKEDNIEIQMDDIKIEEENENENENENEIDELL